MTTHEEEGQLNRIKDLAQDLHKRAFPSGESWEPTLEGLLTQLKDRYKHCRGRYKVSDPEWRIWVGRFYNHTRMEFGETGAFKYLDGMRTVLNALMKYHGGVLAHTAKKKTLSRQFKELELAFKEVCNDE